MRRMRQTRENMAPPTVGKEALIAKESKVLASYKSVTTTRLSPILMEGDTVVFHWRFEFTPERRPGADDGRARAADLARRGIDRGAVLLRSAAAGACASRGRQQRRRELSSSTNSRRRAREAGTYLYQLSSNAQCWQRQSVCRNVASQRTGPGFRGRRQSGMQGESKLSTRIRSSGSPAGPTDRSEGWRVQGTAGQLVDRGLGVGRRDRVVGVLAIARLHFGAEVEPAALGDVRCACAGLADTRRSAKR